MLAALLVRALPVLAEESGLDEASAGEVFLVEEFDAELKGESGYFPDPVERQNRAIFRFNCKVDDWILDPVARTYAFAVPNPVRAAMRRFFDNLNSPVVMVNDLLQREGKDAGITTARFALNTTVGIGGLFDPATAVGLEGHYSDFGQTLALAGVASGPYLIVPVFGPTTMRGGVGTLVDVLFRPTTYLLGAGDQFYYSTIYGGSVGVIAREQNAQAIEILKASSVDYYAALRSAYYQLRTAQIWRRQKQRELTERARSPWPADPQVSLAQRRPLQ